MPVELEGYVRPGCTILTLFIAMPKFMWVKLFEDPVVCIHHLVTPRSMLSGRGTFVIYLNSMMFRIMRDGTSVIKVKVEEQAPKLHYVHPTCFEAGKPLEFVACGSNLLQPKFRFLVSFGGKYLTYDVSIPPMCNKTEDAATVLDHELLKICVPPTDPNIFGPAFIEVENESGLSNFIPILIADKEICSEITLMQKKFDTSFCSRRSESTATSFACGYSVLRQEFSEFILDMAWLLKEPSFENMEDILNSSQLQRFTCLLKFLIENESSTILERMLYCMKSRIDNSLATGIAETDIRLFQRTMSHATNILGQKFEKKVKLLLDPRNIVFKGICLDQSSRNDVLCVVPATNQEKAVTGESKLESIMSLTSTDRNGTLPLLNGEFIMSVNLTKERPRKSSNDMFITTNKLLTSRPLIFIIAATAAVCFGICAALLHPQKASQIATTIRRCLIPTHGS